MVYGGAPRGAEDGAARRLGSENYSCRRRRRLASQRSFATVAGAVVGAPMATQTFWFSCD
jgi:hypothetical protein